MYTYVLEHADDLEMKLKELLPEKNKVREERLTHPLLPHVVSTHTDWFEQKKAPKDYPRVVLSQGTGKWHRQPI